jgi:hypothetical protein
MTVHYSVVATKLRDEASHWRQWAHDMTGPAHAAANLHLSSDAFLFAEQSMVTALSEEYTYIQSFMSRVLAQAAEQFNKMAETLDRAATIYESVDLQAAENSSDIKGMLE